MKIKIPNTEVQEFLSGKSYTYPKYVTQLLVLANQNAQGTRPKIEELVIVKTFSGLKFQEAILKKMASHFRTTYRLAQPEEESRGIDGFVGDRPISIKPTTYKTKMGLNETIDVPIVFYEKKKSEIVLEFDF